MKTEELKEKLEEQKSQNLELFNSIPTPTYGDPLNKQAEPILDKWREGVKKIRQINKELRELEILEKEEIRTVEKNNTFVNGFGEATKRYITNQTYEKADKRTQKDILIFMGNR